jgi:23S rRNA (cytosine1962-C5)-methyltransferase
MARSIRVRLRKALERSVRSGHPWLYREALEPFEAPPGSGVSVLDKSGRFLASGLADSGPIAVRVFSQRDVPVDGALFSARLERAFALRARVLPDDTNAYRLVHGEGDGLPGFTCDRYDQSAVLKLDGEAALAHSSAFVQCLTPRLSQLGVASLLLRTGRKQDQDTELVWGPPPARELYVRERGMRLGTNLYAGQKTGLFLDHRETRFRVRQLTRGSSVLNLYGYTGGFSVAAALGGARAVTTVDSAKPALSLAERSFGENGLDPTTHTCHASDALEFLTAAAESGERYELVIADPPNFAPRQNTLDKALAAYEALHTAALRVLAPGGFYLAASCSSHVDRSAFEETLRRGAAHARRIVQVLERSSAPADHPRLLAFPEGDYLKVVLARADATRD